MVKHLFLFGLLLVSCSVFAQQDFSDKTFGAVQIDRKDIMLDGRLEESFWADIEGISDFKMTEPTEGGDPSERTVIKIAYDENYLYIGAIFYDSDPTGIKSFQRRRDAPLSTDDRFMWIIDTFLDGRNAYFFEINPGGLMGDGVLVSGQGVSFNKNWDGIWRPWTYIGDFGWSCEVRIPFLSMNFDPSSDTWGINFQRTIRRKNEELVWSGHQRNLGLFRPQNAGRITGLKGISQGVGLEVVPYVKLDRARNEQEDGVSYTENTSFTGGADINYNITSGLKASITINTDFAETEVDNRQVNLTRFPLFFPERRDFFLEGANIYQFAPSSGIRPYFSRRIGLEEGNPIPINYGGRLIGRVDRFEIAAQHVRTRAQDTLPVEDFSVVRVKRNFGKESSIGVVYTRRSTENGAELFEPVGDRHTLGADLSLNTSQFFGDKNLQFQAFMVGHNPLTLNDTISDFWDRTTRGIRFNFPNRPWTASLSYREFGDSYDPAVGFNRRNSFRRVEPRFIYSPLIEKSKVIRELTWEVSFEHLMSIQWDKLTQNARFTPFSIRFESGDEFSYQFIRNYEQLLSDFDILGDGSIVIPLDDYTNWRHNFEVETASFRRVSYELEMNFWGFWTGRRQTYSNSLTLRPVPGINISTEYIYTNVDLEEGEFDTNLVRFIANFDITPFISLTSNIQYDDLSRRVGMNNRFRYTVTPGSDIFLVYNHNWIDEEMGLRTTSNTGILKATYTHRF